MACEREAGGASVVVVSPDDLRALIVEAVASALEGPMRLDKSLPAGALASTAEPVFLTTRETATLLRVSLDTLERMRASGTGPPWKRIGKRVLYPRAGLLGFGNRPTR